MKPYQDSISLFDNYDNFDPTFLKSRFLTQFFTQDIWCKFKRHT